jgi:tetratricopeptide (TPR) repeat protein
MNEVGRWPLLPAWLGCHCLYQVEVGEENNQGADIMSNSNDAAEEECRRLCCANCGIAGVDDIILEECNDCDLVKYCSDNCREDHREEHNEECKKRQAELYDKTLFSQPDGIHHGECPICFLPLPIDIQKTTIHPCCSRIVCSGCVYANIKSNIHDEAKAMSCPFCREPANDDESDKRMMKRIKANDPAALSYVGIECYNKGDYDAAFGYLTKAAELSDADAHYRLGRMYWKRDGVEEDEEKMVYHWEKAAIGGHPIARHNLACIEWDNGNVERAVEHFIIAAKLGDPESMSKLWKHYSAGNITKEKLDATLRTHQAAIDATRSTQRKIADEIYAK